MLQFINYGSFEEKNSTSILAYFVIIVLFSHYIEADKVKGNCSLHHQTKNPIEKFKQGQNCYCLSPQCLKLEHNKFVDSYCIARGDNITTAAALTLKEYILPHMNNLFPGIGRRQKKMV